MDKLPSGLTSFCFLLIVIASVYSGVSGKEIRQHSYEDRRKCPYWQQAGCLLMSLEKFCELPAVEIRDEFERHVKNLGRCCCPLPFQECTDEEEDHNCRLYYENELLNSRSSNAISNKKSFISRVNKIRTRLLQDDEDCKKYLAPPEPFKCNKQEKPEIARQALRCELLAWQHEELGLSESTDFEQNECPYNATTRAHHVAYRFIKVDEFHESADHDRDSLKHVDLKQKYAVKPYKKRRKCKYWQQSGCMLDVMRKACDAHSDQRKYFYELLTEDENVYQCCCPTPFKACKKRDASPVCLELLYRYFPISSLKQKKSISRHEIMDGIQKARERLLQNDENCQKSLAPAQPFAKCLADSALFSRSELSCEVSLWQWEEMGEGSKKEFDAINCPFSAKDKASEYIDSRKGSKTFLDDHEEL